MQVNGRLLKQGSKTGMWHRDPQTGTVEISIPAKDIRKNVEVVFR
jgi:hypothetical protein